MRLFQLHIYTQYNYVHVLEALVRILHVASQKYYCCNETTILNLKNQKFKNNVII